MHVILNLYKYNPPASYLCFFDFLIRKNDNFIKESLNIYNNANYKLYFKKVLYSIFIKLDYAINTFYINGNRIHSHTISFVYYTMR